MNRREAIQALTALPAVTRIAHADLTPRSVIVLECDGTIDHETAERLRAYLRAIWPDNKCIVLGDGLRLRVFDPKE